MEGKYTGVSDPVCAVRTGFLEEGAMLKLNLE